MRLGLDMAHRLASSTDVPKVNVRSFSARTRKTGAATPGGRGRDGISNAIEHRNAAALCRGNRQQIPRAAVGGLMRHLPALGYEIVQNRRVARPKRFELLTPRFVVWCSAGQRRQFLHSRRSFDVQRGWLRFVCAFASFLKSRPERLVNVVFHVAWTTAGARPGLDQFYASFKRRQPATSVRPSFAGALARYPNCYPWPILGWCRSDKRCAK
jgi:hypothetical protein